VKDLGYVTAQPDEANDDEQRSQAAGAVQREAWARGLVPPVEEVRPGLWSIPVPWPRGGIRYTLAYLLEGRKGPALIDTGFPTRPGWAALAEGIGQTGHDLADIRYVLVTHAHADHVGLAGRIRAASGALVGMHPAEAAVIGEAAAWRPRTAEWLQARGAPAGELENILGRMARGRERDADLARPDLSIEDGSRPLGAGSSLRAVWTPGHTPGHLCFYDERQEVLLTGDHVLPRITPHIGLGPGATGDQLGDFLTSLRSLAAQFQPTEVLPAHEHRFADLGARVEGLLAHHRTRLAEIEHAVATDPGLSTWDVAAVLHWSRGWDQTQGGARQAAVSETWAHLYHLQVHGRVIDQGRDRDSWLPGPRCAAAG
jgi:glyoxylase-like metal-dependent hydrolase (beta-lactamase superfamily II)